MNDKIINLWVKRNNFIINLVVFFIGIILIAIAYIFFRINNADEKIINFPTNGYDIFLGLGCSIVATSIVSFIISALVLNNISFIDEWGILDIHNSPAIFPSNKPPNKILNIIALGLNDFNINKYKKGILQKKIKKGLKVKIITLNPASSYINIIGVQEYRDIENEIEELLKWIEEFNSISDNKIELKLCNIIPILYCRYDNKIYKYSSILYNNNRSYIIYQYNINTKGGRHYESIFDDLWNKSIFYNKAIDKWRGNQEESIKKLLEFFCKIMAPNNNIEGVVVLFKGNYRRTFYSYNKLIETHHVRDKNIGAVGELISYNKDSEKKIVILKAYLKTKKIFLYSPSVISKGIEIKDSTVEKLESHDNMTALLATPLFNNNKLVGAVTFEFPDLPPNYFNIINENYEKERIINNNNEVYNLFDIAYNCGCIIEELLGRSIQTHKFNTLFNEGWEIKNV